MPRLHNAILAAAALLAAGMQLGAHNAPGSAVLLDFHSDHVTAELRLPISELKYGFRHDLETEPATVVARFGSQLTEYIGQHIAVHAPQGRTWVIDVLEMKVALGEQPIDLVVHMRWHPPAGAPVRKFTLIYDVVSHEVVNHMVIVSARSDWDVALLGGNPEVLGALRSFAKELVVDRSEGSSWRGFRSVFTLGMRHIADGTDHWLFLLVLLLPAPLLVSARCWRGYGGLRHSVVGLAKVVTAFTLGHCCTLLLGTVGWLRPPAQLAEILIAVSILVSAMHAVRPIFPGREPRIAAAFGLVHGLAFATVLIEFQLDTWHLASALLAFNLGIECMQFGVVLLIVPWLVLLSRFPAYSILRIGGSLFAGSAALGWIMERAFGWPNPLSAVVATLAAHAIWLIALLAATALGALTWDRYWKLNKHAA